MTFVFATPLWLALLALLPLVWLVVAPRRADGLIVATADDGRSLEPPGARGLFDLAPTLLRTLAAAALIGALAEPQLVRTLEEPVTEGVGIAFAIDLSTSMWAQDMAQGSSRLDVAKSTVRAFLASRSDDVGLVTFAGESLTRVPLTHDVYVIDQAIEELEVGLLLDGTDIAGAIAAGAGLLRDAPHRSKALILVTDGAHNKAGLVPALAARAAAAVGVTIYAVAIGRQEQSASREMETVLTQTTRITGGRYFHATDVRTLEAIYGEIDRLTLPSEEMVERTETEPLAWLLVLVGLGLAVAASVLRGSSWGVLP
jgi:Ca-activated chloride channel family protein